MKCFYRTYDVHMFICVRLAGTGRQPRKTCVFFPSQAKLLILNQARLPADLLNYAQTVGSFYQHEQTGSVEHAQVQSYTLFSQVMTLKNRIWEARILTCVFTFSSSPFISLAHLSQLANILDSCHSYSYLLEWHDQDKMASSEHHFYWHPSQERVMVIKN